jgi:hypothetical protein
MRVNAARKDEFAGGVYFFIGFDSKILPDGFYYFSFNEDVGNVIIGGGDNSSVLN